MKLLVRHLFGNRLLSASYVLGFAGATLVLISGGLAFAQAPAGPSSSHSATSGDAANGKKLFVRDGCYECHGREAQGGGLNGPRIAPNPIPLVALRAFVRHPTGEMPPFSAKVLPDKDVADIYAYLSTIPQPPSVDSIPILRH